MANVSAFTAIKIVRSSSKNIIKLMQAKKWFLFLHVVGNLSNLTITEKFRSKAPMLLKGGLPCTGNVSNCLY